MSRFGVLAVVALAIFGLAVSTAAQETTATPEPTTTAPETTATPTSEPRELTCFVSTDTARSVTVRVGPGENRTAILFLRVGEEFAVVGATTLEDGSIWFKLDKEQVDPGTSAAEFWIAADDADQSGDCEAVAAAIAPPLIPILNSAAAANAQVTTTVAGGAWRLFFADKFIYSCVTPAFVTSTYEEQTLEIMDKLSWDVNLAFAPNQRSFTMTGEWVEYSVDENGSIDFVLTGDNRYTAAATQPDGRNFSYHLTAISPDLLAGETRFHFGNETVKCSETIKLELRRG